MDKKLVNFQMSKELIKRFGIYCIKNDTTKSKVIRDLIIDLLEKEKESDKD